jgi:RNA-dependent RNA polymerase
MVALYRSNRDFAGSPAFDLPAHLSSRHQQDPATLKYSEKNSETSSNSTTPSGRRKMNGARGSPQRRGRHGSGGGRGNSRAYSNSSGGSNDRPILRPMSAPLITQPSPERVLRPNMSHQAPPQVDSPVTPVKQHSSFTLNGNSINETYTARLSTHTTTPPRPIPPTQPSPRTENSRSRNSQGEQRLPQRPITKSRENNWAYEQERKVKLCNIPKGCSTKEVYQAISVYGNVVMVDIEPGTCNAYVVFR